MKKYFKTLADMSVVDNKKFGGKTSSLGEMLKAGLPVPNGFGVSIELQKDYHDKPFSGDILESIEQLFKELGLERVAVRSSAIAEDSSDASWAGQLESYLNVQLSGAEDAIRKCWKSISSKHAIDYAKDKSLSEDDLWVGVTIQSMIDSEKAGVMFTANPITQSKDEIVIESVFGLGEMLVQGIVSPDRYIVDKNTTIVSEFSIDIKQKVMRYRSGRNKVIDLPIDQGDKASLCEQEVIELAKLGLNAERHYHAPQDIEWAYTDGKFYIIQSRPITTI